MRANSFQKLGLFGALWLAPLASGCQGSAGLPAGPGGDATGLGSASPSGAPSVQSESGSGDFATGRADPLACKADSISPGSMPGLVRLTHRQYDFIVSDVLGVDAGARIDFVDDQQFYGFDNNAEKLAVPENQVLRYQATAEKVAAQAAADLGPIQKVVNCVSAGADAACRDRFLSEFVKRMLRRPLTSDELTRYQSLFAAGRDLYDGGDAFVSGVRIVLEAVLQSPAFLYRAELRDTPLDGRVVPLGAYELAARLALTFWASVPDASLMKKADDDALGSDAALEAEVRRMLEDPKAERMFDDFHAQWLEFEKLRFAKDAAAFPGYDAAAFEAAAREETLRFARYVAQNDRTIGDLFSLPVSFVNPTLASVYGVSVPSADFSRVELDPSQRAGLFTQLGFLAGHSDSLDSSPIHRGAYIQKRVLCTTFGQLPANVGSLPARTADIVTTRDQVEAKTEPPGCQFCHSKINPAGFAFEAFDAVGKFRTQDHGADVNAADTLTLDGREVSFDGAVEFSALLADSDTVRRCYETQWFRYGMGRGEANDDVCLLNEIDARTQQKGGSVKELLVSLALSRGFRFRTQEDL